MNHPSSVKLVAYLRVSSSAQAESDTIELQRQAVRSWTKANGHRLVRWCEDQAVSGSLAIEQRPGLSCALEAIEHEQADGVVFTKLDRLARELTVQEAALQSFWGRGAKVYACQESGLVLEDDPSDPMRTAMRQMAGVFAQLERGQIRNRLAAGQLRKRESGGYAEGAPRFGTRAEAGTLVPDESEQAIVERIVSARAAGRSVRAISAELNADGVPSKRGGEWHPTTVARVLNREAVTH